MTTMAFLPPIIEPIEDRIRRDLLQSPPASATHDGEKCPLCGAPLVPRFEGIRDFVTGERFSILACRCCSLGVTWPRITDLARYYGPQYWGGRHGFTAEYCARRRVRLLGALAK